MSSTPIGLSASQIREMVELVQSEMRDYLGYTVEVRDTSKVGEDVNLRMYGLRDSDYTDAVQEKFDDTCFGKLCEVAKLHGEQ
jgi:hypothetical protein